MGLVAYIFTHFVGRSSLWTACRNPRHSPGENEKIALASEKKKMPKAYEQALFSFILLTDINEKEGKKLFHGFFISMCPPQYTLFEMAASIAGLAISSALFSCSYSTCIAPIA